MPMFVIDIEKVLGSEFWSNVYQVRANNMSDASSVGASIVTAERNIHCTPVNFTKMRVRTADPADDTYIINTLAGTGLRAVQNGLLPLFNTLRADFNAATGRPSRKYWRGVLDEADIDGSAVTSDFSADMADFALLFAPTAEAGGIVDPQGTLLSSIVVYPFVQMRQLRRSRRRRTNGGGIFQ